MGAKGLMQIIPRYHADKLKPLGGERAAFEPSANIQVGASILKDCLRRARDIAIALQLYAGASPDEQSDYPSKVITERDRLNQVVRQFTQTSPRQRGARPSAI